MISPLRPPAPRRPFFRIATMLGMAITLLATSLGAEARTCVWKVKGEKNTVYLLGSVHILRPEDHPLPAAMDAALKDSETLVLEVTSADMESPETAALTMKLGLFQDGRTLKSTLTPETYALLQTQARAAGVPPAMLDTFKPWMAGMTVVIQSLVKAGYDVSKGVDKHFEGLALADGKKVEAFETAKFQLELFDKISSSLGDDFLKQILMEGVDTTKMVDDMVAAWKSGDGPKLNALLLDSFTETPTLLGPLLTDRNTNWAKKLDTDYLKRSDNVLVVVGAGHLVGSNSVVELLTKKGYKVEQQ